jgi:hypothetical protein
MLIAYTRTSRSEWRLAITNDHNRYGLDPGSIDARNQGCICDPQNPEDRDIFSVEKMCPVHGLAVLKDLLDSADKTV